MGEFCVNGTCATPLLDAGPTTDVGDDSGGTDGSVVDVGVGNDAVGNDAVGNDAVGNDAVGNDAVGNDAANSDAGNDSGGPDVSPADTGRDAPPIDAALTDPRPPRFDVNLPESTIALCTDGVDNDGNGYADCDELGCALILDGCADGTIVGCMDGVDLEEGGGANGFTDCVDFACSQSMEFFVCGETTDVTCSDGIDNDENGRYDCREWSCSFRRSVTVCR